MQTSSDYKLSAMNIASARQIAQWTYMGQYAMYSFTNNDETIEELMSGAYYEVSDAVENLVGYFCYGDVARIPIDEDGVYGDDALDIGLGMRPDLCGQGRGKSFLEAGMIAAVTQVSPRVNRLRLTVFSHNARAIALYTGAGFVTTAHVHHKKTGMQFCIMILPITGLSTTLHR